MRKTPLLVGSVLTGVLVVGSGGAAVATSVGGFDAPDSVATSQTVKKQGTPVPPGSPGDENGNGILDSSEQPDNPDQ